MRTKVHLCLAVMFLCLFAAQAEAREFTFDFSASQIDNASATVPAFAIGDTINLSLFKGRPSFSLLIVAAPPAGIAGPSYIAKDLQRQASAVVKPTTDGLRITIDDFEHQKIYSACVQNGIVETSVHDTSGSGADVCGTCGGDLVSPPPEQTPAATTANLDSKAASPSATTRTVRQKAAMLGTAEAFPLAEQKAVVDILVAFDQGAVLKSAELGYDTITNFADYAVAKMNMVLEKSRLDDKFFYRLVGVIEVDATYDVINNTLLNALRLRNSGALAPVGAAREKYGADIITLLIDRDRNKSTTSGSGYEYLSNSWSYASFDATGYTCNICDIKTVYERYTMSHETGHNMGCGHSNRQGDKSGPGCHPYSCGYHFVDAAGTNRYTIMAYENTSPASGTYYPVPYFSSPVITPEELGVPVGTPTNNNRQTILDNYRDVAAWREHIVPYDWDVRFLDENGNDIPDGAYFSPSLYVTFTNGNPNAVIYYTYDGSTPTSSSAYCTPGTRFTYTGTRTITACAVIDGVAQSVRTITFNEGLSWSGETGENGNGVWKDGDSSVLSWNNSTSYFYSYMDAVLFPDLAENAAPTVTVHGTVVPKSAAFAASKTAYTFEKGTSGALIHLRDASFAPSGDLTFNVPMQFDAVAFTNPASHTLTFNAPFGQTVTATTGYCTNMVGIGAYGTLVVAPGAGKTQTFDRFNNIGWFYNNAKIQIGAGTVVFKGPVSNQGLFGSTQFNVAKDGRVVLDVGNAGYDPFYTSAVSGEGMVVYCLLIPSSAARWRGADWRGTVALTNISTTTLALDQYGGPNSTVRLTGVTGYPGKSGNTNITFNTTLELVDGADGSPAWTVNNGYSTACTFISCLKGGGTFQSTKSPNNTYVRQGFTVADASGFSGSLNLAGTQFTFGSTARKNDSSQNGTIYIDAGYSVTNMATWTAQHLVVNGELVKRGSLVISDSITFGGGVSFAVDALPANGIVLTSKTIVTNGALLVSVIGDSHSYVASIIDNGNETSSLVFEKAPLPETVTTSISVRYYGDDGWEDRAMVFNLPTEWATNYYPSLDTPEAVAAKYNETAANGATVWQCYMLGLDPTNAASKMSLAMTVVGNEIRFAVEGLGETHALDGIQVQWALNTSTNLVTDTKFSMRRDYAEGLAPAFPAHPMPDKPTPSATQTADKLFYKLTVTFVAEGE